MNLFSVVILLLAGLVAGWWLIPQPQFMKDLYAKLFGTSTPSPVEPAAEEPKRYSSE